MPELPEVETVARQLAPLLQGRDIRAFSLLDDRLTCGGLPLLQGRRFEDVFRLGKQVVFRLERGPLWLCVHLRMTGRLIYDDSGDEPDPRHLRARFELDRGTLAFFDPRRFGTFRVVRKLGDARPLGLEPLSGRFTGHTLRDLLAGSRQPLKTWLLRQDRLVGLGNIYASEILFASRLCPQRPAGSLSEPEIRRLHRATRRVLRAAIACCGTTFSDFQDASGVSGGFQEFLQVYGRDGQRCRRCAGTVIKTVQAGRSTFSCGYCQGGVATRR